MTPKVIYNYELLEQICERDKCIIDYDKKKKLNRDVKIEFTCSCGKNDAKNFRCMYTNGVYCKYCMKIKSNERKIKTCLKKYGVVNPNKTKEVKDKIKATCLKKYGAEHCSQTQEFQNKIKKTCLKRYGVENVFQLQEFKDKQIKTYLERYGVVNPSQSQEIREKIKQTCLENYGVEYPLQSQEIREKFKQTSLKNYGVENPSQSQEIKDKKIQTSLKNYGVEYPSQSQEIKDKQIQTSLENYGVEYPLQSQEIREKFKQTCLENYGVEYPMQNAEFSEKISKNSYMLKEFTFPCGNIIEVQGYEPFLLDILVKEGYVFEEIITNRLQVPTIWYDKNDNKHRYYCDAYIPKTNTIYEVKSTWTNTKNIDKNKLKKQACLGAGFNFELYVFDNKGIRHIRET